MKVREYLSLDSHFFTFKTWRLTNFSLKLIIILHKSRSDLSFVRAESPDFILNVGMKGKIQHCRYMRIFAEFVLTDADERSNRNDTGKNSSFPCLQCSLPKATGYNKCPYLLPHLPIKQLIVY